MLDQYVSTLNNSEEILEKIRGNLMYMGIENVDDHLERAYHSKLRDLDEILNLLFIPFIPLISYIPFIFLGYMRRIM